MSRKKSFGLPTGKTVREVQAKQMAELLEQGVPQKEAEEIVGITLKALREAGAMSRAVRSLAERAAEAGLANEKNQSKAARLRLMELALQDEDIKTAARAAAKIVDVDQKQALIQINTQVNNTFNLPTDDQTLGALKELRLLMAADETKPTDDEENIIDATPEGN